MTADTLTHTETHTLAQLTHYRDESAEKGSERYERKGELSLKLLLSVPRIWVSQPGISHSNANGTPETVSSPKRRKREQQQQEQEQLQSENNSKTQNTKQSANVFSVYFCFRASLFLCAFMAKCK